MLRSAHVRKAGGSVGWNPVAETAKVVLEGRALETILAWSIFGRGRRGPW